MKEKKRKTVKRGLIAGKVPDFVNVNGKKAVLEIFGDYWHRGEDPSERIAIFAAVGYSCAVVWERDFKANPQIISEALA